MMNVNIDFDVDKIKKAVGKKVAEATFKVPCPECGVTNEIKGTEIAAERTITCGGCRKMITLGDSEASFARVIRGR